MKLKFGTITNGRTIKTVDFIVKTILPNKIKDIAIGGSMIVG